MTKSSLETIAATTALLISLSGAPALAQQATFPDQLIGEYTFSDKEACGSTTLEKRRLSGEGFGCTLNRIQKSKRNVLTSESYEVSLSCQMDDPEIVRLSGSIHLTQLQGAKILLLELSVSPRQRKRFSFPEIQLFAKC